MAPDAYFVFFVAQMIDLVGRLHELEFILSSRCIHTPIIEYHPIDQKKRDEDGLGYGAIHWNPPQIVLEVLVSSTVPLLICGFDWPEQSMFCVLPGVPFARRIPE